MTEPIAVVDEKQNPLAVLVPWETWVEIGKFMTQASHVFSGATASVVLEALRKFIDPQSV